MNNYVKSVFINVPFDKEYQKLIDAIIFTVIICGYMPRCSLEETDSSQIRITKIVKIIKECQYSIHDLSRVETTKTGLSEDGLPRFNMPLELGIVLGAIKFGKGKQKKKKTLIFDKEAYRYQATTSDISGQDIAIHKNDPKTVIQEVRNFLNNLNHHKNNTRLYGGEKIYDDFCAFEEQKESILKEVDITMEEITYIDYLNVIDLWQKKFIKKNIANNQLK